MWLQRGDKLVALKKFGLANFSTATDAEIKGLKQNFRCMDFSKSVKFAA